MGQIFHNRNPILGILLFFSIVIDSTSLGAQNNWVDKNESGNYTARHECSFVQAGNKFYLMGGRESGRTLDIYDYTTDSWSSLIESAPVEFNHYQATEYQGLIWVIGAFKTNDFPKEVPADYIWAFDPSTQEWIQGPEIPSGRKRGSSGLVVYNDKFYIVAGNTDGHDGGYVPWFDEYDPASGSWTILSDAPRARDHFHAAVIGNKLYAAAGRLSGGTGGVFKPLIAAVDVYDFNTGAWSSLPSSQNIPTPRAAAATVNFNGKLIIIGGEVQNELVYGVNTTDALKITEQYNPTLETWERLADLNYERHGTQAIVSANGVFILAGSPNIGGGNQKNMEYMGVDSPIGNPSVASTLSAPSSVVIENGHKADIEIGISGGNVGTIISSIEISGPDANDFIIQSGELNYGLLKPNSIHIVTVELNETGTKNGTLIINYGNNASIVNLSTLNMPPEAIAGAAPMEGDIPLEVSFMGSGSTDDVGVTGYLWDFKDGSPTSTEADPVHTFVAAGSYAVELTVTDEAGLTDTASTTISVEVPNAPPEAVARATPMEGNAPLEVTFTGSDSFDDKGIFSYLWAFGDGSTATEVDPIHFYNAIGTYEVTLTVTDEDGLTDIASTTIMVELPNAYPVAVASATPLSGDVPLEVSFIGSNSTDDVGVRGYLWDFKDGSPVSTEADPVHTFVDAGSYAVELTVTDEEGLTDVVSINITVETRNAPPEAVAGAAPMEGDIPLEVSFMGSGSTDDVGVTGYLWDFKDGSPTSTEADPVHTFVAAGSYAVELTVTDEAGLTDTASTTISVEVPNAPPEAVARATPMEGNAPLEVTFTGSDSFDDKGIFSYLWAFGDGSTATEVNPIHLYNAVGTYEVTLTVTDEEGLSNSTTLFIISEETITSRTGKMNAIAYPNPAINVTILEIRDQSADVVHIYLYDSIGRFVKAYDPNVVFNKSAYVIDLSNLNKGIYYLIVKTEEKFNLPIKLIVNN